MSPPPLIAHIIYRLDVGGLENGLVNLINTMDPTLFRHAIICQTRATRFRERLRQPVEIVELHKRPGQDPAMYWRLYQVLRRLRPAIVHTRNLGTLECQLPALLAGEPGRATRAAARRSGWELKIPQSRSKGLQKLQPARATQLWNEVVGRIGAAYFQADKPPSASSFISKGLKILPSLPQNVLQLV